MKKELDELKIYQNMSKIDKMKATYHKPPQKWYLEKRMDAFNIIQEFGVHYRLSRQTIYESFLYADKILAYINEIDPKEFELNVIVCSLIGSKFVENDTIEINYNELTSFSKNYTFTIDEIYLTEISILKKLNYYLGFPSIYEFIQYLNIIGVFFRSEILNPKSVSEDIQNITLKVITSPIPLKYPNEVIAMNIIRTVRKKYKLKEEFMKKITKKFQFEYDELYEKCFEEINFLIFGEVKQEKKESKSHQKLIEFETEDTKNENEEEEKTNVDIQRRKAQAKTTKRPRASIKFEVPKQYIKNIQISKWSSSSSSSSLSSSFESSSSSNSNSIPISNNNKNENENENEKEKEKINSPPKKVIKGKMKKEVNKEKKKKLVVQINENKNQYFEESATSLKLSSNNISIHREKQRKIKPVNKDKINFPFSGKRVATISYSPEQEGNENDVDIEPKKFKSMKGFKTPIMKKIE